MSDWAAPAVLATLIGSCILTLVYSYLYVTDGRPRHLLLWTAGWCTSALLYGLSFVSVTGGEDTPGLLDALVQLLALLSAVLLLTGTLRFLGRRSLRARWLVLPLAVGVWAVAAELAQTHFVVRTLPTYWFLALATGWMGVALLRHSTGDVGARVTGIALILWGLHRADYPFLRPIAWTAPLGYLLSSGLELTVALGMLLVHLEGTRARLAESEERYRRLVEHSPEAVLVMDPGGELLFANPAARRVLGLAPDVQEPAPGSLAGDADGLGTRLTEIARACTALTHVTASYVDPVQGPRELEITAFPFDDDAGQRPLQLIVRDVTDRRRLEGQLQSAAKLRAVGELAGGVAHDFNNLLTAILGYSSLVLRSSELDPRARESIAEIEHAATRGAELTRQLLTFSRRQPLEVEPVDLNQLLERMRGLLARLLGASVRLRTELEPGLGQVRADPAQLELAVMNLAVNARDAMPDGGALTIRTEHVSSEALHPPWPTPLPWGAVRLMVEDSGSGMDSATSARVFEPFFTTKAPGKGTGLGLATVHGVVHQAGGRIEVTSGVGQGTTFVITLPADRPPTKPPTAGHRAREALATDARVEPEDAPREHGRVLVVDDDAPVRRFMAAALSSAGYDVVEAEDAEAAMRLAITDPHLQAVVTDLVMPGIGGGALIQRLSRDRPDLLLLLVSAHPRRTLTESGPLVPVHGFLDKPFTAAALVTAVRALLISGAVAEPERPDYAPPLP